MSEILTNNKYYSDIADTIRQMKGVATTYKPREMAGALRDMYSTEVEGVPPLTFPSNGNNLLNYRIDGANGGVGDRTKNLANSNEMIQGYWAYANGDFVWTNTWICTPKIPCSGNTPYTYQFSNVSRWSGFVFYDENGRYISTSNVQNASSTEYRTYTATSPSNARYLAINIAGYPGTNDTIRTDDLINFQLEEGSTPTDYEPYGYKIPVVCGETTTNIYIEEPIGEDESISMEEANVNIPTINGTNTLSIDTTVQPSKVYVQAPKNSGGGGIDFAYAKLEDVSTTKNGIIGKVTEIDLSNITFVHCLALFQNATNLTTILNLNTEGSTSFSGTFSECSSLETLPNINTSNSSNFSYICSKCTSLKNVPVFDMVKCEAYNHSNMFQNCSSLTNESLNNILASLLTAKNIALTQRTLAKIGLSETQATTCTTLSNWQSLVDKGWTTGY